MAQNSFYMDLDMDAIECEAMQEEANVHCLNCLSGKKYFAKNYLDLLKLKTTQQLPEIYIKPF